MKLYTCPKCGHKMADNAPNFCPNCGCQSSDFTLEEVETNSASTNANQQEVAPKRGFSFLGCLGISFGVLLVLFLILTFAGGNSGSSSSSNSTKMENYNDNSQYHQILAKNWYVDHYLKPRMNDPKSYKEEKYDVKYDYAKEEYIVTISFRGKNAFGATVLSTSKGSVKFTDDGRVQCRSLSD